MQEVDVWLEHFRRFWDQRLDALGTELARGKREWRGTGDSTTSAGSKPHAKGEEDT